MCEELSYSHKIQMNKEFIGEASEQEKRDQVIPLTIDEKHV